MWKVLVQIYEFKLWTCKFAQETYNGLRKAQGKKKKKKKKKYVSIF